uniref:DUF4005 domain-containing protein n=1 Tax=Kalanchoe fedtschenkoi TaxID=63787 RepID=A0A7N0UV37_KALFE
MGRKGKWFSSIKKALSPASSTKKHQEKSKSKSYQSGNQNNPSTGVAVAVRESNVELPPQSPSNDIGIVQADVNHQTSITALSETVSDTQVTAEPQVVIPGQLAPEVIEVTTVTRYAGKSVEEVASIKIQTVFRGYLARRALRAIRGLVRLNLLVQGPVVKRQATNTLRCMQTLARVQSQIRSRRVRMSEENEALQRQLLQKHVKELEKVQLSDEWNDSARSKEQVEANLVSKHEAAMRRERALAYAFTHQQTWKNTPKTPNTMFMDPTNPSWGWSWLERWMSARPWEQGTTEKELNDHSSVKSATRSIAGGEINKSYARHQLNLDKPSPASTPRLSIGNRPTPPVATSVAGKVKSASPRAVPLVPDDDMKSLQSEKTNRRHSYAGSSVRDNESLASSPSLPSYMVPTQSAKAKLRMQSPVGLQIGVTSPDKVPSGVPKKRLSYPASPARPRRHSGPPKVESSSIAEQAVVIGVES